MAVALKPGNMDIDPLHPRTDDMSGSIADAMDHEFDRLLRAAQLPGLTFDMTDRAVRDRRRLFVAIARGLVIHLKQNSAAFSVIVPAPLPAKVGASIATDGV
ncbi:MAG TPA: hypothetical protein VGB91_02475 [Rhizomicrobium sp.]